MKKVFLILMMALPILFTQCKKTETTSETGGTTPVYTISFSIEDYSKADINPSTGAVTFKVGDAVYVASNGVYVGKLTYNGTSFTGNIQDPTVGKPLYVYTLGGDDCITTTLRPGSTTKLEADISNQATGLPIISYAVSNENFDGPKEYTGTLYKQYALVKFNASGYTGNSNLCIKKMNNLVTVNLSSNIFVSSKTKDCITLHKEADGEYWALLMPNVNSVSGNIYGDACDATGFWMGTYGVVLPTAAGQCQSNGVTISLDEHKYVDLGLPSGLKWATHNIGASSPEEIGTFFAWGETNGKSCYDWSTYKWGDGYSKVTKYNTNSAYGSVDNKTTLDRADDAAKIWGDNWRTPTYSEICELANYCTSSWTTQNGMNGRLMTGSNGNSIFLPAGGYYEGVDFEDFGNGAYYMSSSLNTDNPYYAYSFIMYYNGCGPTYNHRTYGTFVRPVYSK